MYFEPPVLLSYLNGGTINSLGARNPLHGSTHPTKAREVGMQQLLKSQQSLFTWIALAAIAVLMTGCETAPVYRSVTPQEASAIVEEMAGTEKPANRTMRTYYLKSKSYTYREGVSECNNRSVAMMVTNLVIKAGEGNFVEGTAYTTGDCAPKGGLESKVAGRYDDDFYYEYSVDANFTNINKYQFVKSQYGNPYPTMSFVGYYQYVDDVWTFTHSIETLYLISFDIDSTGYVPQDIDFRPYTADYIKSSRGNTEDSMASTRASIAEVKADQARARREEAEAERTASATALNDMAASLAVESAQRRAVRPSVDIVAESQRAADADRANVEHRAAATRQGSQTPINVAANMPASMPAITSTAERMVAIEESKKRHTCVYAITEVRSDYEEAAARSQIQKSMQAPGVTGLTGAGDPYKVLSLDISCKKEATNINPQYDCVGRQKNEVSQIGRCGGSSTTAEGVSK